MKSLLRRFEFSHGLSILEAITWFKSAQ